MDAASVSAGAAVVSAVVAIVSVALTLQARRGALAAKFAAVNAEHRADMVAAYWKQYVEQDRHRLALDQAGREATDLVFAIEVAISEAVHSNGRVEISLRTLVEKEAYRLVMERREELAIRGIIPSSDGLSTTLLIWTAYEQLDGHMRTKWTRNLYG